MDEQMELTSDMRAILVDWMVEVQANFRMSHETLYLAVKLMDRYLMKAQCEKNHLQLLGSTAYMIAAKFEESYPPSLTEFLYICEDLYPKSEMVSLERNILKTLNFDINIPIAYHFLRRYASVPSLEYSTGYQLAELHILVRKLNHLLNFRSRTVLKNVFEKYSEETYFEVAKIPPLSMKDLEDLLNCALFS
ncbi:cyclin B3 (predicted) [Rattus norvegicus]|uniref:Cyclin B3 (Predicted) n=1 Tax=Rattus norvegicus TaxID=10116 RepID=A6KPB7_RAT|nr:cyclin B3 (predicted) [Rattus norvegicus]